VRGNRYSVPIQLVNQTVLVRISLETRSGFIITINWWQLIALKVASWAGWTIQASRSLWQSTLKVEQRPLEAYRRPSQWS